MADGDAAAAAGYTVAPSSTAANLIANLIARVQDDIAGKVGNKGAVIPVALGGTGGATSAAARTALGAFASADVAAPGGFGPNLVPRYDASSRLICANPIANNQAAPKLYVDNAVAGVSFDGGTVTGQILLPNSFAATSGYTIAYINGDGRISRGASSRRYKKEIHDAPDLGDLFAAPLREFRMRVQQGMPDDPTKRIGYIAEELVGTPMERFVVNQMTSDPETGKWAPVIGEDGSPVPDSIDFISLLLAQNAQLHERLAKLEAEHVSTD